jgi:hypothetical protein
MGPAGDTEVTGRSGRGTAASLVLVRRLLVRPVGPLLARPVCPLLTLRAARGMKSAPYRTRAAGAAAWHLVRVDMLDLQIWLLAAHTDVLRPNVVHHSTSPIRCAA